MSARRNSGAGYALPAGRRDPSTPAGTFAPSADAFRIGSLDPVVSMAIDAVDNLVIHTADGRVLRMPVVDIAAERRIEAALKSLQEPPANG